MARIKESPESPGNGAVDDQPGAGMEAFRSLTRRILVVSPEVLRNAENAIPKRKREKPNG